MTVLQVQNNKQSISALKVKTARSIDTYKTIAAVNHRIVPQWTNDEMLLAVQGKYFLLSRKTS